MRLLLTSSMHNSATALPPYLPTNTTARLTLITTAALPFMHEPHDWYDNDRNAVYALGYPVTEIDLTGKTSADVADILAETDILYVSGGDTFKLMAAMHQCAFADALRPRLAAGMVYIGSSAGSIVTGPDIAFIEPMEKTPLPATGSAGLGLVPFQLVPHVQGEEILADAARIILLREAATLTIGLQDTQVLYVHNNSVILLEAPSS